MTVEALRKVLTTDNWQALDNKNSELVKILQSSHFKDPEAENPQTEEQIDYKVLATFTILNCHGDAKDKIEVLYNILQDGGVGEHAHIAASDKDFPVFWNNLLKFATLYLFEFLETFSSVQNNFTDQYDKIKAIIEDDDDYDSLQGGEFLSNVFGEEAKLQYDDWRENIIKHTPYLFNPHLLRLKIFKFAKLEYKPVM